MAGEKEIAGVNREAREYSIRMQARIKLLASRERSSQAQNESTETTETGLPKAINTSTNIDIKIVATTLSDANVLTEAIADPEKPHIEAYPLNSDEPTKSQ